MLYFGRVGSSWGHCVFFGSSWGKKVITPYIFISRLIDDSTLIFFKDVIIVYLFKSCYVMNKKIKEVIKINVCVMRFEFPLKT